MCQMSVTAKPQTWWQHAGHAVKQECHSITRRQASLRALDIRRAQRLRYQARPTAPPGSGAMWHAEQPYQMLSAHVLVIQTPILLCQSSSMLPYTSYAAHLLCASVSTRSFSVFWRYCSFSSFGLGNLMINAPDLCRSYIQRRAPTWAHSTTRHGDGGSDEWRQPTRPSAQSWPRWKAASHSRRSPTSGPAWPLCTVACLLLTMVSCR